MKALIIYDNFAVAVKASAALQHTTLQADTTLHWIISPWRIDMLKFASLAEESLTAAADTHLLVFAGFGEQPFPKHLHDWLKELIARRPVHDIALALVDNVSDAAFSTPAKSFLAQFAEQNNLGLIANCDMASADKDACLISIAPKKLPTALLPQPHWLGVSIHDSHQNWGINE